jgi:hypothetical protein
MSPRFIASMPSRIRSTFSGDTTRHSNATQLLSSEVSWRTNDRFESRPATSISTWLLARGTGSGPAALLPHFEVGQGLLAVGKDL